MSVSGKWLEGSPGRPKGKETGSLTEAEREICRETIIYFDKLGFGWVIDRTMLEDIKTCILGEEDVPNNHLMKIIENILSELPG